jgi:hypothetical protein
MSHQEAFIDFVLRLEAMRQKQELTPDGARSLLSNTESMGSSAKAEENTETATQASKATETTEGETAAAATVTKET